MGVAGREKGGDDREEERDVGPGSGKEGPQMEGREGLPLYNHITAPHSQRNGKVVATSKWGG